VSGAMALRQASRAITSTSFEGGKSFYDQIMELNSRHKLFMTEQLYYKVYVHSRFIGHHCLVLVDKSGYCEHVTIELTVSPDTVDGESSEVAPKAQLYDGRPEDLTYKGEIYASLEYLCEVALRVLVDMGSYNLAFNNCQHFCDKLLKKYELPGHTTDTTKIGLGTLVAGGIIGIGAVGYSLYKYFNSSGDNDTHGKEKRKN